MTDNEIIKALETLLELVLCEGCPQRAKTINLALDLINRQKAENSNLTSHLTSLQNDLTSAKAEIERLMQKLQQPQVKDKISNNNIVYCKDCKHLMFSDFEGECSKGYKGIVRPKDSCPFGERIEGK